MDWAYRSAQVIVRANEALKLYAGPEVSSAEFRTQCADVARREGMRSCASYRLVRRQVASMQEKLVRGSASWLAIKPSCRSVR